MPILIDTDKEGFSLDIRESVRDVADEKSIVFMARMTNDGESFYYTGGSPSEAIRGACAAQRSVLRMQSRNI